jgi:hypothetical protein
MSDTIAKKIQSEISQASGTDPMAGSIFARPGTAEVKQSFSPSGGLLTWVKFSNLSGELVLDTIMLIDPAMAVELARALNKGYPIQMEFLDNDACELLKKMAQGVAQ